MGADPSRPTEGDARRDRAFVRQYLAHTRRLYGYILTCVPSSSDADDIFQDVTLVMWQKYEAFDTDAGFFNWAVKIARNKIKQHIERQTRAVRSNHLLAVRSLEELALRASRESYPKQDALRDCLKRLRTSELEMLRRRYAEGATTSQVAADLARTVSAVYKALNRIHTRLARCVERKMVWEGLR